MVNACLLPVSGMDTAQFCEFIDLANFDNTPSSEWGEDSTITSLVNSGWLKREGSNKHKIALHPTISLVGSQQFSNDVINGKCDQYIHSLKKYSHEVDCSFYRDESNYVNINLTYIF